MHSLEGVTFEIDHRPFLLSLLHKQVRKNTNIRNQVPHLTQDTTWKSDKNTRKHHIQQSQESMSSLTSGGAADAEIENIHIVWRRGSPTSIVVGLQQPTCFIHLVFILAGPKSPGGFSWTISLRFRNQILLYSAVYVVFAYHSRV